MCRDKLLLFLAFYCFHVRNSVSSENFLCSNGSSIAVSQVCDGVDDCDGSDELVTSSSCINCNQTLARCTIANRTCLIDINYICNKTIQCETTDSEGNISILNPCDVGCATHYRCRNNQCHLRSTICDGSLNGCRDDEDEFEGGTGFKCIRKGKRCRIPQQMLWDDVADCDREADLCYILSTSTPTSSLVYRDLRNFSSAIFDQTRCFMCLNASVIIPRQKVCDGLIDCPDLSDECLCEGSQPEICQRVVEKTSASSTTRNSSLCEAGEVQCTSGSCILRNDVCDSHVDCSDAVDEKNSYCGGSLMCRGSPPERNGEPCRCDKTVDYRMATLCNGISECPAVIAGFFSHAPVDECPAESCKSETNATVNCPPVGLLTQRKRFTIRCNASLDADSDENKLISSPRVCDGIADCEISKRDESPEVCRNDRFICISKGLLNIPKSQVCDGVAHCDHGTDEIRDLCTDRFFCANPTPQKISFDMKYRCDFEDSCDDSSDELNCNDTRFYCQIGYPLYIERAKVFDGHQDCEDGRDECPMDDDSFYKHHLSSKYHFIASPVLKALVWIMAVTALTGNLIVIKLEITNIKKIFRKKSQPASLKTYHILLMNLAIADLLMGIYLLCLGIADVVFSGSYCVHELKWLTSNSCQALGSLVVISSEASIITIIILTSCRMFAVFKPFSATTKPTTKTIIILLIAAWFFPCVLAFVPFASSLEYVFADTVILQNNPFFERSLVNLSSAASFGEKLLTFDPQLESASPNLLHHLRYASTWKELQSLLKDSKVAELLIPFRHFGYYSSSSVCIPQLFVTKDDKVWQYSLFLTIFNFLAFSYVACAYSAIIRKLKSTKENNFEPYRDREIQAMQRKIYRLIASDFCSWVPISIMAFVNFSGVPIPSVAYAVSAVVLLPINSALNPILYFDVFGPVITRIKDSSSKSKRISKFRQSFTASTHLAANSNFTAIGNNRL